MPLRQSLLSSANAAADTSTRPAATTLRNMAIISRDLACARSVTCKIGNMRAKVRGTAPSCAGFPANGLHPAARFLLREKFTFYGLAGGEVLSGPAGSLAKAM